MFVILGGRLTKVLPHVPNMIIVVLTSNRPQNLLDNYPGLCITPVWEVPRVYLLSRGTW